MSGQLRLFDPPRALFDPPRALFDPLCVDCDVDTVWIDDYYMVRDDVWPLEENGTLCVACLEARIGRRLTPADFTGAPINHDCEQSARLASRLRGHEATA
jgi:hypothetical protein